MCVFTGSEYNIPVCIWLHETHPVSRPRCYVCPSVSMVVNPSCPCVDASGNISLDGLKNWTHVRPTEQSEGANQSGLVSWLSVHFLLLTHAQVARQQAKQSSPSSSPSWGILQCSTACYNPVLSLCGECQYGELRQTRGWANMTPLGYLQE